MLTSFHSITTPDSAASPAYAYVWVSLGTHYFSANGTEYVELTDATGEALSLSRMVGFDALRFVK